MHHCQVSLAQMILSLPGQSSTNDTILSLPGQSSTNDTILRFRLFKMARHHKRDLRCVLQPAPYVAGCKSVSNPGFESVIKWFNPHFIDDLISGLRRMQIAQRNGPLPEP